MINKTIEEMEDYVMLQEMRALKDEPTVTYEEFLKIMGLLRNPTKNHTKSDVSINRLRN
jgi:hypothetical protein